MIEINWFIVASVAWVLSLVSLYFSYYRVRCVMWQKRYRMIRGVDHCGMFLELLFSTTLLMAMVVMAWKVYPQAAARMTAFGLFTWVTVGITVAVWVLTVFMNFTSSLKEIREEVESDFPEISDPLKAEIVDEKTGRTRWDEDQDQLVNCYKFYVCFSIINWGAVIVTILLFGNGAWHDFIELNQQKAELTDYAISGVPHPDGIHLTQADVVYCERLLTGYIDFREELLEFTNHFLGALVLFFAVFLIMLGTRYQDLYTQTTINIYRTCASICMFILLPGVFLYGYGTLVLTSNEVSSQYREYAERALEDTRKTFENGAAEKLADDSKKADFKEFNDVYERLIERASVPGFIGRMASSWGGIILIAQFLLARIGIKRLDDENLWSRINPQWGWWTAVCDRIRLFLSDPEEDRAKPEVAT